MRRFTIAVLAALLFVGFHGTQHVFAITYAAGWNLVAGPEGSRLTGASGSIFTMQPGDTDYESFPADSPLHGGYGYWAFFPSGGSITLTGGSNTFSVASIPGQFIIVGNPSQAVVTISGADTAFTYTPAGGYQNATAIPPGQGAWVMGSQIDLAGNGPTSAPPANAPVAAPQSSSAPTLTTFAALRAVALNSSDLPGYQSDHEKQIVSLPGLVAGYDAGWSRVVGTNVTVVGVHIFSVSTDSVATIAFNAAIIAVTGRTSGNFNIRQESASGIGNRAQAVSYNWTGSDGTLFEGHSTISQRGLVVVSLDLLSDPGGSSITTALGYARIIDARITGQTPAPVTTTAAPVSAPTTGHLLQYSSSGNADTPNFTLPTSGAYVCAQVSGRSSSGLYGPSMSAYFYRADGQISSLGGDFDNGGCKIMHTLDGPGNYYIDVVATPWTNWTITVDAQ
jgi:hypothetical protein